MALVNRFFFSIVTLLMIGYCLLCTQFLLSQYSQQISIIKSKLLQTPTPLFIIHIGPRKTASTYIKNSLYKLDKGTVLKKDNFIYLNGQRLDETNPTMQQRFQERLEELRSMGENIIISDEKLPRVYKTFEQLNELRNKLVGWNVRVIMTYRRYFDWIISEYDQEFKRTSEGVHMNSRTLVKFYDGVENNPLLAHCNKTLYDRWKMHFDNVVIFNMHNDPPITNSTDNNTASIMNDQKHKIDDELFTEFICKTIPEAKNACTLLQNHKIKPSTKKNKAEGKVSSEALLIVRILKKRDLILLHEADKYKNLKLAELVDTYLMQHYSGLNKLNYKNNLLSCLDDDSIQDLYNKSVAIEKELLPKYHNEENGAFFLKMAFDDAVRSKRFCQLDVRKIIEKEEVQLVSMLLDNY